MGITAPAKATTYWSKGVRASLANALWGPVRIRAARDILAQKGYQRTDSLLCSIAGRIKVVEVEGTGRVGIDAQNTQYAEIDKVLAGPDVKTTLRTRWASLNSVETKFGYWLVPGYLPVYLSSALLTLPKLGTAGFP